MMRVRVVKDIRWIKILNIKLPNYKYSALKVGLSFRGQAWSILFILQSRLHIKTL